MNKTIVILMMAISIAACKPKPNKIGIINIQVAIQSTTEGQKAIKDLQVKYADRYTALKKKKDALQVMFDQLRANGKTMGDDARDALERRTETMTYAINADERDLGDEVANIQNQVVAAIGTKMMIILDQYAVNHGIAIVFVVSPATTNIMWAAKSTDVTSEIIKLYNIANPTK